MLELLVALVILAVGICGVLQAFSSSTLTCKAAEVNSNMALLAQQVAGELERRPDLQSGRMSGTFGPDIPEYAWEAEIKQSSEANLYRVEIHVTRQTGNRNKFYPLITCLRLEPQQQESSEEMPPPNPQPGPEGPP